MAELDTRSLYNVCDPSSFDFKTTADIADGPEIIDQPRAVEAIRFGMELRGDGYNTFASGPEGVGK